MTVARSPATRIVLHGVLLVAAAIVVVACIVRPFLPGPYDGLAVALSTMAQLVGVFGLLPALLGVGWLVHELRNRGEPRRSRFALAAVIACSIPALALCVVAYATIGVSFGLVALLLFLYVAARIIPNWKSRRTDRFDPAPLYLVLVPVVALLAQLWLAGPVTELSRNHAIAQSTELIRDVERYHDRHGRYPTALEAVWKDYRPSVAGIKQYDYAAAGDAYNVIFEQPRMVLDIFGTREFVVYNPRDEQTIVSHDSWILLLTPERLETSQGWYAVHDAAAPRWKYFWFD